MQDDPRVSPLVVDDGRGLRLRVTPNRLPSEHIDQRTAEIMRWCEDATQQFVDAPVQTFVPILVEHIVRNRMIESRASMAPALTDAGAPRHRWLGDSR